MKEEAQSIQSPAPSNPGCGPQKRSKVAEPPSMNLGIGIGALAMKQEKRRLTAEQQDEFQRQVLIYKYIAAGIPVPSALVRPISKSIDDSLCAGGVHRQYPSFVGFSKEHHYQNMIDPEPGRCRRTDGKKWRCKKNVIPGQKYCQQHMHRGCRRSRKPVESSHNSNPTIMGNPSKNWESSATIPTDTTSIYHKNLGATSSSNAEFKIMGAIMSPSVVSSVKSISTGMIQKGSLGLTNAAEVMTTCTVHTDSTFTTATIGGAKGSNNRSSTIDDGSRNRGTYVGFKNQIDQNCAYRNLNNVNVCSSQKLNFSPKSVLQVQGDNSGCLSRSGELELGRCRRTDGKKWRCHRDVVPDEKYCKMHMHRGAKTRVLACQSPPFPQATTSSRLNYQPIKLNTNLSISLTANPQDNRNTCGDGNSTISSSSDTISDTIVANCDYRDVTS